MGNRAPDSILTPLSKILSVLLHPLLMPVYAMLIILLYGLMPYAPAQARIYLTGVVILDVTIVPLMCMLIFSRVKPWHESTGALARERILPMTVMIVCYVSCLFLIKDIPYAFLVRKALIAGICCITIALAVTFFWKISLHMTAAGAMTAFIGLLVFSGMPGNMIALLCVWVALAAMLASARLLLGAHDAAQVAAGYFGGIAVALAAMLVA